MTQARQLTNSTYQKASTILSGCFLICKFTCDILKYIKDMNKKLFIVAMLFSCIFSCGALAATEKQEEYGGLLKNIPRDPSQISTCHFFVLLDNVIDFILFQLNIWVTICLFVYIGILYYFGGDDPSKLTRAQITFKSMMIGLFIMYGAWLFITLILSVIGAAKWVGFENGAFLIKCVK